MPNLSDYTRLANSTADLLEAANRVATNVKHTVDNQEVTGGVIEMCNLILKVGEYLEQYALDGVEELEKRTKHLN